MLQLAREDGSQPFTWPQKVAVARGPNLLEAPSPMAPVSPSRLVAACNGYSDVYETAFSDSSRLLPTVDGA